MVVGNAEVSLSIRTLVKNSSETRRVFLRVVGQSALAFGAATVTSACGDASGDDGAGGQGGSAGNGQELPGINVGPLDRFQQDGLYKVAGTSVLVGRDVQGVFARSSLCTHQGCNLNDDGMMQADGGIECGCHGSEFDSTGGILGGPATKPLPAFAVALGLDGNLYVDTGTPVDSSVRLDV
jgi:cytochrome b6-f complex iron-sulfur subunit